MSWLITTYIPSHTPALRRVYLRARQLAFPWTNTASFQLLDFDQVTQGEQIVVATVQHVPVGFIAWWPPDNFIHSLFVDPLFVGKGIGKSLMQACLQEMGRPATLKCNVANERALRFYHAQGWTPVHRVEDVNGPYWLLTFTE